MQEKATKITVDFVGFLGLFSNNNEDYAGAILVTDDQGIPLEFRYTEKVKPTELQKTLYGKTLLTNIGVSLCGVPLIQAIETRPNFVLVNNEILLNVRKNSRFPVIFIKSFSNDNVHSITTDDVIAWENQQKNQNGQLPLQYTTFPTYEAELAMVKEALTSLSSNFNLFEPFQRIEKALETVAQGK
jgi:hypothetical protein